VAESEDHTSSSITPEAYPDRRRAEALASALGASANLPAQTIPLVQLASMLVTKITGASEQLRSAHVIAVHPAAAQIHDSQEDTRVSVAGVAPGPGSVRPCESKAGRWGADLTAKVIKPCGESIACGHGTPITGDSPSDEPEPDAECYPVTHAPRA
jgi:hypothetical protein